MAFEISELARCTGCRQITGRCANHPEFVGKLACNQRRILKFPDPDRQIEALANDIDKVVGQMHVDFDIGVARHKGW